MDVWLGEGCEARMSGTGQGNGATPDRAAAAGAGAGAGGGSAAGRGAAVRVLVVDDSAFMRKALSQLINSDPGLTVIDTARNGEEMIEKVRKMNPDVVTLDIEMPVLNGHEALKRLKAIESTLPEGMPAVLVCSSLTSAGSHDALQALSEGAADVIAKEASFYSANMDAMRDELVRKIKAVAPGRRRRVMDGPGGAGTAGGGAAGTLSPWAKGASPAKLPIFTKELPAFATVEPREVPLRGKTFSVIAIGASTGGPPVLEKVLSALPADLPCPIVIAQHMPATFTKAMSERLDGLSPLSVIHGEHGMPLHAGSVYVIPGGQHGRVRSMGGGPLRLEVSPEPRTAPFKPSVTELLMSVAQHAGNRGLGVVFTGIGDDEKLGAGALLAAGGLVFAQDPATSAVYGMPRAAGEVGGTVMTPDQVARSIASLGSRLKTDSRAA